MRNSGIGLGVLFDLMGVFKLGEKWNGTPKGEIAEFLCLFAFWQSSWRRKCIFPNPVASLFGFRDKGKATFSDFNPLQCKESGRRGIRHASQNGFPRR